MLLPVYLKERPPIVDEGLHYFVPEGSVPRTVLLIHDSLLGVDAGDLSQLVSVGSLLSIMAAQTGLLEGGGAEMGGVEAGQGADTTAFVGGFG